MNVAIVGAGPAGCRAAELIALQGFMVRIFDPQGPWEKPCGGGVTTRALRLAGNLAQRLPSQPVRSITAWFGDRCSVSLEPAEPMVVVSRKQLGIQLLAAAESAGAAFVKDRVVALEPRNGRWRVQTREASFEADVVIGADGATSFVRRNAAEPLGADDLSVTLGYFIKGQTGDEMKVFFVPGSEGYIWSFPRPDHLSYGLITRPGPHWTSRGKALLDNYVRADLGQDGLENAEFYSAPVPRLRRETWKGNTTSGEGWALIGDAAGLVDPITGEGIYYALRSAQLLAETFPDLRAYQEKLQLECVPDLERAAALYDRFYSGRFLGGSFRKRMIQFARRSATVRAHAGRLISGDQPYRGLRWRLLKSAPRVAMEMVASPLRGAAPDA